MSRKLPSFLIFFEKIFGIVIFIIGVILTYFTYANIRSVEAASIFLIAIGNALIVIGLILLISKTDLVFQYA